MGIDPAYGTSSFGIVITQFVDGLVQILHAEEYKRPDFVNGGYDSGERNNTLYRLKPDERMTQSQS
jgi:hypothetical protein